MIPAVAQHSRSFCSFAWQVTAIRGACALAAVLAFLLAGPGSAEAQSFSVLYSFPGYGQLGTYPFAGLTLDSAGNVYGTTYSGGTGLFDCPFGCGLVFEVNTSGQETVLHMFGETSTDGQLPQLSSLFRDSSGNLHGTTYYGGVNGSGTVFKITPSGKETFFSFQGGASGGFSYATLIPDNLGNLYGTTVYGGSTCLTYGCGTVFKLSSTGQETVLYAFAGGTDGAYPVAGVVRDKAGNFYGTTANGGSSNCYPYGCGTVFKLSSTGQENVLYSFTGGNDGDSPYGGLVLDSAGNLYGTTYRGGSNGAGAVFKVSPTGQETVLYSFTGGADGGFPYASLIRDGAGKLYGTTVNGGATGNGVVFEVAPNGSETVLYSFCSQSVCTDGSNPYGNLVRDNAGNFYSTTSFGGDLSCNAPSGCGTVFKLVSPPTITKIFPISGAPGTAVTLTGVSLTQTTSVTFNGDVPASSFTVNSDTQVTAIVPVGALSGKILVTSPGGSDASPQNFTVFK